MTPLGSNPRPSAAQDAVAVCHARDLGELVRALRVAGYRLGSRPLTGELLNGSSLFVEDAFGHPVELQLHTTGPTAQ